jgi:hypothetical protein
VILDDQELHRFASRITIFVWDILMFCACPRNMKLVLEKTLFHVKICKYFLDYILPFKLTITQQEVLVGVSKALEENKQQTMASSLQQNKQVNNGIKLVILNVTVSAHKESSMRTVTKTFGSKFFKVYH